MDTPYRVAETITQNRKGPRLKKHPNTSIPVAGTHVLLARHFYISANLLKHFSPGLAKIPKPVQASTKLTKARMLSHAARKVKPF
jgi:hypothetical protein